MYGWIFRHIPGPLWLKILVTIIVLVCLAYLMMVYLFPWAAQYIPWNQSTITLGNLETTQSLDSFRS